MLSLGFNPKLGSQCMMAFTSKSDIPMSSLGFNSKLCIWYSMQCKFVWYSRHHLGLLLFFWCRVAVSVLWLFLTGPWVGLQCVNVVFTDHTYFFIHLWYSLFKKASEYDQEMPQSHTQTRKVKQPALSLPQRDDCKTRKYIKYFITNVSVVFNLNVVSAITLIYLGNSLSIPNSWFKTKTGI